MELSERPRKGAHRYVPSEGHNAGGKPGVFVLGRCANENASIGPWGSDRSKCGAPENNYKGKRI